MASHASSKHSKLIRTAVLFAFSMLVMLGVAPLADAAKVGYSPYFRTAYYLAYTGEANAVSITSSVDSLVFADPNAPVTADFGCKQIDAHSASCPSKNVQMLYVKTSDLDDSVSLQPLMTSMVDCGLGSDTLVTPNAEVKPAGCEQINPPAPTTPVTPPTVTPPPPPLSIVQPVSTMTRRGSVPLTLSCSADTGSNCTGTLTFILPSAERSGVHAARRGAPNIIGREKIVVRRGKKRRVKVSMTGKGRRMVRRQKRLKVTAKLRITQGGQTTTTTQQVTIKAPRKR